MRTAHYWVVMPKSTVDSRLREKSAVGSRLREKEGGRRRGKEERRKKRKSRKNTSRRPRPRIVAARGSPASPICTVHTVGYRYHSGTDNMSVHQYCVYGLDHTICVLVSYRTGMYHPYQAICIGIANPDMDHIGWYLLPTY
ncbi:hypothetical protein BHE74_00051689 [Ensete ventricosum]|nr:hypothetical protein BHE74_00051689 [Ensete ventricosum]